MSKLVENDLFNSPGPSTHSGDVTAHSTIVPSTSTDDKQRVMDDLDFRAVTNMDSLFEDDDDDALSDHRIYAPPGTPADERRSLGEKANNLRKRKLLRHDAASLRDSSAGGGADVTRSCLGSRHSDSESPISSSGEEEYEGPMSLSKRAAEQAEHLMRKVIDEAEQAEQLVMKVLEEAWKVCHFSHLPNWLQDNDFLHRGHRPPLPSFSACFRSIFRIHTETGNIWTHLLGCLLFLGIAVYFLTRPSQEIQWQEKIVFTAFFLGAVLCMGMSFVFHTVSCHSEQVGRLFSKFDYCGIALLIIGSFVPWLYYGFYCDFQPKLVYLTIVVVLGCAAVIVSLWDKFGQPKYRPLRAGVFTGFGLSGVIPAVHYLIAEGFISAVNHASFGWLCLMGALYILGAILYALRVPERFFPGKFDIVFHSHQLFHLLVIAAAFVHYHGITQMATQRLTQGECHKLRDQPLAEVIDTTVY